MLAFAAGRARRDVSKIGWRDNATFRRSRRAGAAKIMSNMFDPEFMVENELVFIGSPETVAEQDREGCRDRLFNTFHGRVQLCRPAGG